MKLIKVKPSIKADANLSIPDWVKKTLTGLQETRPYIYKAVTEYAMDYIGDLTSWLHNNGQSDSKVINSASGRFIKITDPMARNLEQAGFLKAKF